VRLDHEPGTALATVVLDRPEKRNAQTPAMWRRLAAVGRQLLADDAVRVVLLRAEGPSFSAGLDRAMFTTGLEGEPGLLTLAALDDAALDKTIDGFQQAFAWWRDDRVVSIAAVQGHAVGAGFQLALGCDLRVVADDVQLAMKETSLGLVPDLGGTRPLGRRRRGGRQRPRLGLGAGGGPRRDGSRPRGRRARGTTRRRTCDEGSAPWSAQPRVPRPARRRALGTGRPAPGARCSLR
jgi:enoyl-CoA hydratase/carnithine racemase